MNLYAIEFLQHDAAGMKREAAWLRKPSLRGR
jgi:hypothetical protein